MAQNIVFNGVVYEIPDVGDDNWGQNLTDFFVAIPGGVLQKSGGTFTLTADLNFGATYGLIANYFKSNTGNIASAGKLRLANTDLIDWRNAANSANLALGVNGSDALTFAGVALASTASPTFTGTTTFPGSTVITSGGFVGIGVTPILSLEALSSSSTAMAFRFSRGTQGSDAGMPTAFGSPYGNIGGGEFKSGGYQTLGFGYSQIAGTATSIPPIEMGFVTTSTTAFGKGDFVLGLRDVTSNTAATERFRVTSAGVPSFSALTTQGPALVGASGLITSEAQLAASRGGTALNTSASTGIPSIAAGTWSVGALTGDVTTVARVTTIATNVVTNAKAAQMAANTIKGNNTGSTANAADLTVAQTAAMFTVPTVQRFTSSSGNYTTPANVKWIKVRAIGAGGGGGGGGAGSGNGGAGGNTTFGTGITASGGAAGASGATSGNGGAGGTSTVTGSGTLLVLASSSGGSGSGTTQLASGAQPGGVGGNGAFGGGGGVTAASAGTAGATNTGGGGGGGGATGANAMGGGGGAGGYGEAIIFPTASQVFAYAVGAAGTAGAAGTNAGGAGGSGLIIVEEHYI